MSSRIDFWLLFEPIFRTKVTALPVTLNIYALEAACPSSLTVMSMYAQVPASSTPVVVVKRALVNGIGP